MNVHHNNYQEKSNMRLVAIAALFCALSTSMFAQRIVLAEIFTNSHCSVCPTAYTAVANIISNTPRAQKVITVFNHVATYADDAIYQANRTEPIQRGQYLGFVSGTPAVYINGSRRSSNGSGWDTFIDGLLAESTGFTVTAAVTYTPDSVVLNYTVTRSMGSAVTSASVYALLTEDITYSGRNGISDHKNALRKLFTPVAGTPLTFDVNGIANGRIAVARSGAWDVSKLHGIVSVQDPATKASLQVTQVDVEMATSVDDEKAFNANSPTVYSVYTLAGNVVASGTIESHLVIRSEQFVPSTEPSGVYLVRTMRGTESKTSSVVVVH